MQFSEDHQLLLTLTGNCLLIFQHDSLILLRILLYLGAPDYVLMCWNWTKAKLIAHAPACSSTYQVESHLHLSTVLCIPQSY